MIFFIERTQFYSFLAALVEIPSAVQAVAIQFIAVDPLFLIPCGTCVMRSPYERSNVSEQQGIRSRGVLKRVALGVRLARPTS